MKKSFYIFIITLSILALSGCKGCSFSKGFSKDLSTKLSATYNGFSAEKFALTDLNNRPLKDNRVQGGSGFSLIAYNIDNFTLVNGRAYPVCEMTLSDEAGKTLLHIPDIFAEKAKDGISTENGNKVTVTATFTIPADFKGSNLHANVKITDKNNPKNDIVMTDDVLVI